jgi:two-component system sensor histidine kinase KdpD
VRRDRGYALAVALPIALTVALVVLRGRDDVSLASALLCFQLVVVVVALVGGFGPALVSAVLGSGLVNFFLTPPFHTFAVARSENVVALVVFVVVAILVGWVVDVAARRTREAAEAIPLAEADRVRTALLAAVGHDLRAPLAAVKAVVSGLRSPAVVLTDEDRDELLATADSALDKLAGLVDNLLDMSRLQVGAMPAHVVPTHLEEIISRALDDPSVAAGRIVVDLDPDLPQVMADAGLLERVVVNLIANAQRYAPSDRPTELSAVQDASHVLLRVIDSGPGIPRDKRDEIFVPFQRLGDTDNATGVGLGLAVARGLAEAMGGTVSPAETPGGGLTMVVALRVAGERDQ